MINFYDGQLTDLLPHNITDDPGIQALSYALREGTRLLYKYKELCFVYCSIETMPDKILDVLAVELRTQYYRDTLPIETKRALVRNTLIWYMTAGTPAAVEELVTVVFGNGEVTEWFEFGGEPYWFRVKTDAIITEEMTIYFSDMIRRVKNTRSHLDAVEIPREVNQTIFIFPGVYLVNEPQPIIDGYTVEREAGQKMWLGGITGQNVEGSLIADGYSFQGDAVDQTIRSGGALVNEYEELVFDGYDTDGNVSQRAYTGGTLQAQQEGILFDGYHFIAAVSEPVKAAITLQQEHEAELIDGYETSEQVGETIYTETIFSNLFEQTIQSKEE